MHTNAILQVVNKTAKHTVAVPVAIQTRSKQVESNATQQPKKFHQSLCGDGLTSNMKLSWALAAPGVIER
jgi:hypothetical protein